MKGGFSRSSPLKTISNQWIGTGIREGIMAALKRICFLSVFFLTLFAACGSPVQCLGGPDALSEALGLPHESDEPEATAAPPRACSAAGSSRLHAHHLVYKGAFAFPRNSSGNDWTYGGHALAYYPRGDRQSVPDGYPGSLYTVGHAWYQLVGEISIPRPVISGNYESLPRAAVLRSQVDITGGRLDNCIYYDEDGNGQECLYREVAGLEYLPNINRIVWNLRDWYNVGGQDLDSLGWSNLKMRRARGMWYIGPRFSSEFHNGKTCDYLFLAPESFASTCLEGKRLISGNHRGAGAFGGSQGPTLYALAPWEDGKPQPPRAELDALALVYYPEVLECIENPELCHFPGYRTADIWAGGAWIEAGDKSAVLIFGRKGLGPNYYGPGNLDCDPYKGWHADPYEPQILFYDPADIVKVREGAMKPWQVVPYEVAVPRGVMLAGDCASFGAVAYDSKRRMIYATEPGAGEWGAVAVHVWQVKPNRPAPGASGRAKDRIASE
jgi:hypothetical protein